MYNLIPLVRIIKKHVPTLKYVAYLIQKFSNQTTIVLNSFTTQKKYNEFMILILTKMLVVLIGLKELSLYSYKCRLFGIYSCSVKLISLEG